MVKPRMSQVNVFLFALVCSLCNSGRFTDALSTASSTQSQPRNNAVIGRRNAFSSILAIGAGTAFLPTSHANAAEDNQVLTDDEMQARVARKMELLRAAKSKTGGPPARASDSDKFPSDIRSDVNPDAAVNLRSRSAVENAKIAMQKQKEMKTRDTAQKREDLCEMLGRGC